MESIRIKLLVGVAVVSTFSSLLCVILVFSGSSGSGQKNDSINPLACVECDTLEIQGAELLMEKLKRKTDKDGKEMCCALNSKELSTILLELTLKKARKSKASKQGDSVLEGVHIPASGLYVVHSSLYFKPEEKNSSQQKIRLEHHIKSGERHLMKGYHTCHNGCRKDEQTNYLAGTFYLQAGDHLTLETPNHNSVILNKETSYIKATLLGSREKETI